MPEEMSTKEIIKNYEKIAKENIKELEESKKDAIPPEVQEKIAKAFKKALRFAPVALTPLFLAACAQCTPPVVEEQQEEEIKNDEVVIDSPEIKPVEEEVVEKIDVPEIPGLTFNQETKSYFNEAGVEVGAWIENAVKIEGKMTSAIALKREAGNEILEENSKKGIFKCLWPFDWQKDKGMEIVELFWTPSNQQEVLEKHGVYLPNSIGIRYTKPINFYSPFDVNNEASSFVGEYIPDKKEDQNFFSAQKWKNLMLLSDFSYGLEETGGKRYGSIQFTFIDWNPLVALSEIYGLGDDAYAQDIIGKTKAGTLLGQLLPRVSDFEFLDFVNNPEFYENPGQFQSSLVVYDFQDDFSKPTSSLEKMLNYKNKAGQEIPVCVWSEENTAHEQTN